MTRLTAPVVLRSGTVRPNRRAGYDSGKSQGMRSR